MPSRAATKDSSKKDAGKTYEEIMGGERGVKSLSNNLIAFRKWVKDSGCAVHPAVCVVNGEATDGTRNAPILAVDVGAVNLEKPIATAEGRSGLVDTNEDRALYDRTIGCQIRTVREMKEGQVLMTVPKTIMVHPDLIAASDAGRVALACVENLRTEDNFWDAFSNTREKEQMYLDKNSSSNGTQLLVKIIQERKKVEMALAKATKEVEMGNVEVFKLAKKGSISTRAAVLLFLIHQRFSDSEEPMVVSGAHIDNSAIARIELVEGTPKTFAPYARTMPPSIALPICWKRNELALLAECIPGISLLQDITGQLMTLSSDLLSLIEAGILHRFPSIFSPKLLTWDRWLWAATVHMSRLLPATCYLNKGEETASSHVKTSNELFYSPPEVWDELGVMVPLIDMLNHEVDEAQIKWESPSISSENNEDADEDRNNPVAQVIVQKKVKKGNQIYFSYGPDCNKELLLKYGFCQMGNKSDKLTIGWGLHDAVGNVSKPENYLSLENVATVGTIENDRDDGIYESLDTTAINTWWSQSRLDVLKHEMRSMDPAFWDSLVKGKKMVASAYCDGVYHPHMLTAMVVATMSRKAISMYTGAIGANPEGPHITLNMRHQRILRRHMLFFYTQKLEKLLENFGNGLKAHFNNVNLWTKATEGGLEYTFDNHGEDQDGDEAPKSRALGWNSFFDRFAYTTAMEVESHFYSLAPDSCVLALYDGNLRAIQESINGVVSEEAFNKRVLKQLQDLGFEISTDDGEEGDDDALEDVPKVNDDDKKIDNASNNDDKKRKKDRQRKNKQSVLGIKLHIGNLSYQTTRSRLFDYFGQRYGRENILDCHIPTERDSGKSRGFGFVTLTEPVGMRVISDNQHHEVDGRVLKLAESNTSIEARKSANGGLTGDRCIKCGYRAKYCLCYGPNGGPLKDGMQPNDIYGTGPLPSEKGMLRYGRRSRSRDRWSRSPSPRYHRRGDSRDRMYDRRYRERVYHRSRSRSRSYSRGRDQGRDFRDRDWERDHDSRRSSRSSKRSKRSSRYSRSRSRNRSKSRSRSPRRDRDRGRKKEGDLSPSPENRKLPPQDRTSQDESRSSKRRRSSRSRSRDRHSHSPRKKKSHRRSKDRTSKRRSRSRSRSP